MYLGYLDLPEQFPQTQGPDVFDHDKRNVDLQTWLMNAGIRSCDTTEAAPIMQQFVDLRDQAEDF